MCLYNCIMIILIIVRIVRITIFIIITVKVKWQFQSQLCIPFCLSNFWIDNFVFLVAKYVGSIFFVENSHRVLNFMCFIEGSIPNTWHGLPLKLVVCHILYQVFQSTGHYCGWWSLCPDSLAKCHSTFSCGPPMHFTDPTLRRIV